MLGFVLKEVQRVFEEIEWPKEEGADDGEIVGKEKRRRIRGEREEERERERERESKKAGKGSGRDGRDMKGCEGVEKGRRGLGWLCDRRGDWWSQKRVSLKEVES